MQHFLSAFLVSYKLNLKINEEFWCSLTQY
jgi:hypothetical protein